MQEEAFPRSLSRRQVVKGLVGMMLVPGLAACAASPAPTLSATKTTPTPTPAPTFAPPKTFPKQNTQDITRILTYRGHSDVVNQVLWSPDIGGKYIASVSDDGTARIWVPSTGELLLRYAGMGGPVKGVTWSPDGTRIAIAGATVQVIDVASGRLLLTFKRNNVSFRSLAWSLDPESKYIVAAGADNMAYLLDAATGSLINQRMVGSTGGVTAIAWPLTSTGQRVVACAVDGTVQSWDALTGGNIVSYAVGVRSLSWIGEAGTTDAELLLVFACADHTVQIWNAASASKQNTLPSGTALMSVAASLSKSVYIAAGRDDGTVPVWMLYV